MRHLNSIIVIALVCAAAAWFGCLTPAPASASALATPQQQGQDRQHAEQPTDDAAAEHENGHEQPPHGDSDAERAVNAHGDHHDPAAERASAIAVSEPPSWYPWVVGGAAALFLLAATLGSLALIAKGPEPPDPADAHHHQGTDSHGHGH